MDAQTQDVVRWLLLVGATAVGALAAELAQQRWWGRTDEPAHRASHRRRVGPAAFPRP